MMLQHDITIFIIGLFDKMISYTTLSCSIYPVLDFISDHLRHSMLCSTRYHNIMFLFDLTILFRYTRRVKMHYLF